MSAPTPPRFDIARSLARFDAWWACDLADRAPVAITAEMPADAPPPPPEPVYDNERARWFDIDTRLARLEHDVTHRPVTGDCPPRFMPNLGPEVVATCFGAELTFTAETSWTEPCCDSPAAVCAQPLRRDGVYWSWIVDATQRSLARGAGHWLTAVTDLHGNGDLYAALRDPQAALMDMALDPEGVDAAMRHCATAFAPLYHDQADLIRAAGQPTQSWIAIPVDGLGCVVQCDLIAMISPEHLRRFILPHLEAEMALLDRSIFHLDGPGALRHLDDILACRDLDAVQWVYGAGQGRAADWIPVYQRIIAGGKAAQVCCADIDDARAVMAALPPTGLWLAVGGAWPLPEIEAFLEEVDAWSGTGPTLS